MSALRVWAPRAESVVVVSDDGRRRPLRALPEPDRPGWWELPGKPPRPGERYGFSLDGGPPLPDPRSPSQPDGPQGLSRWVDYGALPWSDDAWKGREVTDTVLYELHVGTFTPGGTFESAIERLDHLVDLGVGAVELLPVAEFPGERGWGYDGVDLFAPHHAYGGPEGLVRFVDACHGRGLAVVFDVVYNHLGPWGNYLEQFGPYFTERYATPWGMAVNLDGPGSDEVRRFFIDNALMWLRDYHGDGLRLDAVHAIVDTSAWHFLEQLRTEVDALSRAEGRPLSIIAESDLNDPRLVTPRQSGGYGLDAQWSDDFHHALHSVLTGERSGYYADFGELSQLAHSLRHAFVYDGRYSAHRRRRHGRRPDGLPARRFLGYLQNHDQVGNRACGERSSALMSHDRLKMAAALVLLAPFTPMLFQGEEWAASTPFQYFTDHPDADLGRAVSEGRRREFASFGWAEEDVPDPQDPATFQRSRLDWTEVGRAPHAEMLEWHRRLIALRAAHPEFRAGPLEATEVRHGTDWLTLRRASLAIVANFGRAPARIDLAPDRPESATILLTSKDGVSLQAQGIEVPAESVAVLEMA